MKIPLSKRLQVCCDFVRPGDHIADIGCDHGYLGIYLLSHHIAASVIAADLRAGPLHIAVHNANRFHVYENMKFYQSDGVRNIPRNFDTLICAGMGGETIVSILSGGPWLQSAQYRLILQCQTKAVVLRRFLNQTGWHIRKEVVVRDGKFLYTVMEVVFEQAQTLTPGQWYISPALLQNSSSDTAAYFCWIRNGLKKIVDSRGNSAAPELKTALEELNELMNRHDLAWLKEASL